MMIWILSKNRCFREASSQRGGVGRSGKGQLEQVTAGAWGRDGRKEGAGGHMGVMAGRGRWEDRRCFSLVFSCIPHAGTYSVGAQQTFPEWRSCHAHLRSGDFQRDGPRSCPESPPGLPLP